MLIINYQNFFLIFIKFTCLLIMQYEAFPQPEEIKSTEKKHLVGTNKSGRSWKLGVNRTPQKNFRNKGNRMTWDEKK